MYRLVLVASLIGSACAAGPPPDLGHGTPTVAAEKDGVVLELWLDRTAVKEHERLFAKVRVTNQGTSPLTRDTSICTSGPAPIAIYGQSVWPDGQRWEGAAADFKSAVLSDMRSAMTGTVAIGQFMDVRVDPAMGCSLMARMGTFNAGESVEATLAWDAVAYPASPFTTQLATVRAAFESSTGTVEVETPLSLEADDEAGPTAVDYVDIALGVDLFREWVEAQPRHTWDQATLYFWPAEGGSQYPPGSAYSQAHGKRVASVSLIVPAPGGYDRGEVVIDTATRMVLGNHVYERRYIAPMPTPAPRQ